MASSSNFLFINKHAKSGELTHSSGWEKSQIFSHAQQTSMRASGDVFRVVNFASDARPDATLPSASTAPVASRRTRQKRKTASNGKTEDKELAIPRPGRALPVVGMPFENSHEWHLWQVYCTDVAPLLFPIPAIANASREFTFSMVREDEFMHSAFSYMMSTRVYKHSENRACRIAAMASKQRALVRLRQLISPTNERTLNRAHCFAIGILLWAECFTGNLEDMKAHTSGLKFLLPRAQDTATMPMYNLRIIHACSSLCAAILNIPPPLRVPPAPEESQLSQNVKAALASNYKGGHAFSTDLAFTLLNSSLAAIAADYRKLIIARETLGAAQGPPDKIDVRYVCLQEAALEYRLQDLQFRISLTPHQHAIRLALLIYSSIPLIAATGPAAVLSQTLAANIRENLERTDLESCWGPCSDTLLWILVIGSFLSYLEDQWSWFQDQTFRLMTVTGVTSFSNMEDRLRACYYSRYLASIAKVIWSEFERTEFHNLVLEW